MQFINGYSYPRFNIYYQSPRSGLIETIDLSMTGEEGCIESIKEIKISHLLNDYSQIETVLGYKLSWNLSYAELIQKGDFLKIMRILNYQKDGRRIFITPRVDMLPRFFEVIYDGDELTYGITKGGANALGNKGVSIHFTTKNMIGDPNIIDPESLTQSTLDNFAIILT